WKKPGSSRLRGFCTYYKTIIMSLSDTTFRHQCILRKLERGPASLEQLKYYYELECETHGYNFFFSNRTFLRDKQEILSLYKKDIVYLRSEGKYMLEEED